MKKREKRKIILLELVHFIFVMIFATMFVGNLFLFGFFVYVAGLGEFENSIINMITIFLIFNVYFFSVFFHNICEKDIKDLEKEFKR